MPLSQKMVKRISHTKESWMTEPLGIIKGNKIVWETHLQGTCIIRATPRDVARLLSCLMFHPQHHIKLDMVAPACNLSTQERERRIKSSKSSSAT